MAINLDRNLLDELGLGSLPDSEKSALLAHIYETLEMRVGMRLADQMTNEQLDEFEKYFEAKDDAGAFHWLETNFPNYKEIVQEEFNKLKEEVRHSALQILQSSQAQSPMNNPQPYGVPGQPQAPQHNTPPISPQPPASPYGDTTQPPFTPPSPMPPTPNQ